MLMDLNTIDDSIYKIIGNENHKLNNIWNTQIVFHWRWWLGITLLILPWVIWAKIRDKKDTIRQLFIILIVIIITSTMDDIGVYYNCWYYIHRIIPACYIGYAWDYSLFPIGIILTLQFNPKLNIYIKTLIFSILCAFIFEPFFVWIGMYHLMYWKYWYSFVIYIPLYFLFYHVYKSKLFDKHYLL